MIKNRIIKASRISGADCGAGAAHPAPKTGTARPQAAGEAPKIVLHRKGDLIEALEVTCACGRSVIVECVYDEVKP